jgi:VWFA-related protein
VFKCPKYLTFLPLLAGFASAQQPASPVSPPPAPAAMPETVLRATTRLIQVNVIVHDKDGKPVRDLKKEDFTLLDNGKPQQIAFFSMDSNAVLPQSAKLPPNVFTNQLRQKSAVPASVTVILIDELNTKIQDQLYARQQVIRYLKTIHPEDRVAIYALGSGLRVLHDFTTDSSDLLRRLEKYTGFVLPETTVAEASSFQGDSSALQLDPILFT